MIIVTGNLDKIVLIRVNACLHTTMYFFLSHLSFVDLCFSTIATPMMLRIFLSERLLIQLARFSVIALVHVGIHILAVMAFDQYMDICNPLLHGSRTSKSVCTSLIMVSYVYGSLTGLMETMWTYNLASSGHNEINHF